MATPKGPGARRPEGRSGGRTGSRTSSRTGAGAAPGRSSRPLSSRGAVRPESPTRSVRATEHGEVEPPPRKVSLTGRAAVLAVVLVILVVSFALPLRSWFAQRGELDALRGDIAADRQSISELERQLERWEDPRYIEAQARERLRWVKPGDVGYIVIGDDPAVPDTAEEIAAAGVWWERLWSSVEVASQSTAPDPASDPTLTPAPGSTGDPSADPTADPPADPAPDSSGTPAIGTTPGG